MSATFQQVTDDFLVAPQLEVGDLRAAQALGVRTVINNRPDGEVLGQPEGDAIAAAAQELGLRYFAIPVDHAGFSHAQIDALDGALGEGEGKVLAFCRSGTRSILLWALTQARRGMAPGTVEAAVRGAGYDPTPVSSALPALAGAADAAGR